MIPSGNSKTKVPLSEKDGSEIKLISDPSGPVTEFKESRPSLLELLIQLPENLKYLLVFAALKRQWLFSNGGLVCITIIIKGIIITT